MTQAQPHSSVKTEGYLAQQRHTETQRGESRRHNLIVTNLLRLEEIYDKVAFSGESVPA